MSKQYIFLKKDSTCITHLLHVGANSSMMKIVILLSKEEKNLRCPKVTAFSHTPKSEYREKTVVILKTITNSSKCQNSFNSLFLRNNF